MPVVRLRALREVLRLGLLNPEALAYAPGHSQTLAAILSARPVQVLREVLHCKLPVELVWQGPREMDAVTLEEMQKRYGPLRGYNISTVPFPQHHRNV
jgi:hypothetical protein